MKNNLLVLTSLLIVMLSSCGIMYGTYIPLPSGTSNPYYAEPKPVTSSSVDQNKIPGDSVNNNLPVRRPTMEYGIPEIYYNLPFYDTIIFCGNEVYAWKRYSGNGSCCAPVRYKSYEPISIKGDTLFAESCRYKIVGDTLFPLHRGQVFVKE